MFVLLLENCMNVNCNHGNCIDGNNTFSCNCEHGYTGRLCEYNIDDCQSRPCQHGAFCQDSIGDYNCYCRSGYFGKNCEKGKNIEFKLKQNLM